MNLEATRAIALQSRLTVEPVPDTRLVQIYARDVKPERARLIADAVADAYVAKDDRRPARIDGSREGLVGEPTRDPS